MKLNLLPTTVSKQKKAKTAWIWFTLISLAGVGGAVVMMVTSQATLKAARDKNNEARPKAQQVEAIANSADETIAKSATVIRNTRLAEAMKKHSSVYPDLYDKVRKYIPPFYRVTNMSATAGGADSATITLVGTLQSHQQYADVVLALMRYPGAVSVSRQGFVDDSTVVPQLDPTNQKGERIKPGQGTVPTDISARLAYFESQAVTPTGYLNASGFGGDPTLQRGAMPQYSVVTIQLAVKENLQTPDPRATLTSTGGTAAGVPGAPSAGAPNTGAASAGAPPPPATGGEAAPQGKGAKGKEEDI